MKLGQGFKILSELHRRSWPGLASGPSTWPVGVVGINKGKHIDGPLRAASTLEFGLVVRPKKATEFKSISYFHSMYLSF